MSIRGLYQRVIPKQKIKHRISLISTRGKKRENRGDAADFLSLLEV